MATDMFLSHTACVHVLMVDHARCGCTHGQEVPCWGCGRVVPSDVHTVRLLFVWQLRRRKVRPQLTRVRKLAPHFEDVPVEEQSPLSPSDLQGVRLAGS